jgi:MOSC domain-containing protein YiiM
MTPAGLGRTIGAVAMSLGASQDAVGSAAGSARTSPVGVVVSVNVGRPSALVGAGRQVVSGFAKSSVDGAVGVGWINLAGDDQADRRVHGGRDKAVYVYAVEDYAWWATELGRPVPPGWFGENLTIDGIDVTGAWIGDRWRIGSAVLEVTQPRFACFKLGMRMNDPSFAGRFDAAYRPGAYLRTVELGSVERGDPIERVSCSVDALTVRDIALVEHTHDRAVLRRIVDHPTVAEVWKRRAAGLLAR